MANIGAELRGLPLEYCIGAPMMAAIKAQGMSARQTVDFIKEVGLKQASGAIADDIPNVPAIDDETGGDKLEARYVEFGFDRVLEEKLTKPDGTTASRQSIVPSRLTVPLLSIVPIPYIRINDMTIDFEYKIKDIETQASSKTANLSTEVKGKSWFMSASIKGSFSSKSTQKRSTDKSATLRVTVNAVQDQIPEGLGRVLDILHDAMRVVPISEPTPIAEITETGQTPAVASNAD